MKTTKFMMCYLLVFIWAYGKKQYYRGRMDKAKEMDCINVKVKEVIDIEY